MISPLFVDTLSFATATPNPLPFSPMNPTPVAS
jgi:hypothetical protein